MYNLYQGEVILIQRVQENAHVIVNVLYITLICAYWSQNLACGM